MSLYTSNLKSELDERYQEKAVSVLWQQLWFLVKVSFATLVIKATWGTLVFPLVIAVAVLLIIYYLNRI